MAAETVIVDAFVPSLVAGEGREEMERRTNELGVYSLFFFFTCTHKHEARRKTQGPN
jgi:hypothetical protein